MITDYNSDQPALKLFSIATSNAVVLFSGKVSTLELFWTVTW